MSRANRGEGTRPVTVPATTAPNSVTPIGSPCRLMGWSLTAGLGAGKQAQGSVTSPGAAASIAAFGTLPAGEYTLNWTVELSGTIAAAELNNFQANQAGIDLTPSVNPAVAGPYPQPPLQIVIPAGGATLNIKTIAAGTVGAVYSVTATLTGGTPMEASIADSGQVIGESAAQQGFSDTQILTPDGVYVSTSITITVLDGTLTGVIYVRDGVEP